MHLVTRQNFIAFALCALSSLAAMTEARCFPDTGYYDPDYKCEAPKEGLWEFEKFFPAAAFPDDVLPSTTKPTDLVLAATLEMNVTVATLHVFNGTGIAYTHMPEEKTDSIVLSALFDPDSCSLSGTVHNKAVAGSIVFRLHSSGDKMSGPLLVTYDGVLAAPLVGFTHATLIE